MLPGRIAGTSVGKGASTAIFPRPEANRHHLLFLPCSSKEQILVNTLSKILKEVGIEEKSLQPVKSVFKVNSKHHSESVNAEGVSVTIGGEIPDEPTTLVNMGLLILLCGSQPGGPLC